MTYLSFIEILIYLLSAMQVIVMNKDTDEALVAALCQGEHAAFEAIYKRYATKLFHYIQRNVSSRADAEEILHDIFETLWKNHRTLTIWSLGGYLFTMARNKIIRHFEHNKVKRKYEQHFILFEAAFDFLYEAEADKSIDPAAFNLLIDTGLAQLPERCQAAFKLRLVENLSNAEIARRMNITKATVQNYMTRAIASLREARQNLYKPG
jgi:RNA polymerase sigma-70 factor (family 1)